MYSENVLKLWLINSIDVNQAYFTIKSKDISIFIIRWIIIISSFEYVYRSIRKSIDITNFKSINL